MRKFEVIRHADAPPISILIDFEASAGMAITRDTGASASDRPKGVLANTAAIGFLKRFIVNGGPPLTERADLWPGHAELPDAMGGMTTLDPLYEAYEAEGEEFLLLSGTGKLQASTPVGTLISFKNGKAYIAQSGDVPQYKLGGIMTTTVDDGAVRCLFERI